MKKLLPFISLLALSLACQLITPDGEIVTKLDCYQVNFLGSSRSTDGVSTWRYRVEELACAQDSRDWMLELPACATVVDASPSPWEVVYPEPNYQLDGIKWETGAGFRSGEFSVMLSGDLMSGAVHFGVKEPDVAIGVTEGPICMTTTGPPTDTLTVTPTVTSTLDSLTPTITSTVTNTSSSTESPPVPPTQPPASSGPILITDNNQTLTFTCNGNAVEVRGNANVITLLGSCSSITVRGNANQVYWQDGSPVIMNTGNENIIQPR